MDFPFMTDNLSSYMGTGLLYILLLAAILYLGVRLAESAEKKMFVWLPVYGIIVYFCPVWWVYMRIRDDAEILYRLLWLVPTSLIIGVAAVTLISKMSGRLRIVSLALVVVLIMMSGKYLYTNKQYSKAENPYHVPQAVVDICDYITIPGRLINACFPKDLRQYVRQYTSYVGLPYGREVLFEVADYETRSPLATNLDEEHPDAELVTRELRALDTQYLIVKEGTVFDGDLSDYEFEYVTTIDGYDLYLDKNAYLGMDFVNFS